MLFFIINHPFITIIWAHLETFVLFKVVLDHSTPLQLIGTDDLCYIFIFKRSSRSSGLTWKRSSHLGSFKVVLDHSTSLQYYDL